MEIAATELPGVTLIKPKVFGDARGFFMETFNAPRYQEALGVGVPFVQDNYSRSSQGVLRGLHFQLHHPQGKLVMVARGEVFDVAVDVRVGSPTFAHWYGCILSSENHHQLFIPAGFAHGFCVLSESADFIYKCTEVYQPEDERGIIWNDGQINIAWPVAQPNLSTKDQRNLNLAQMQADGQLPVYAG